MYWTYEKIDEELNIEKLPPHDLSGKITGKHIIGLKAYFDENPEERIRLGWIKHIKQNQGDIDFDPQTQYVTVHQREVDDHTIIDEYIVRDKTEEMMLYEELYNDQKNRDWEFIHRDGEIIVHLGGY